MQTTIELLDLLSELHGDASDYRLAKLIGVNRSAISNYRRGVSHFGNREAFRVAELLNLDPAYVVACAMAERSRSDEERAIWERVARAVAANAAGVAVVGAGLSALPSAVEAGQVCILCKTRARAPVGYLTDLPLAA